MASVALTVKRSGLCLFAVGMIATLVLVVLSLIPPPPDETIIDGQENFSLTVGSEPRAGFTFWREWGTKGTEHFLSIRITSPSRSEVDFWEVWERHNREGEVLPTGVLYPDASRLLHRFPQMDTKERGVFNVTAGQKTWA